MGIHTDQTTTREERREAASALYDKTPNQAIRDHEARLLRLERKIGYLEKDLDSHLTMIKGLTEIIERLIR